MGICRGCRLAAGAAHQPGSRPPAAPGRYLRDPRLLLPLSQWSRLGVPARLAFLLRSSLLGRMTAFWPGPDGVSDGVPDPREWDLLAARHPLLCAPAPDVEVVLACRADTMVECLVVPAAAGYALTGWVGPRWEGAEGGPSVRRTIAGFVTRARARARPLTPVDSGDGSRRTAGTQPLPLP